MPGAGGAENRSLPPRTAARLQSMRNESRAVAAATVFGLVAIAFGQAPALAADEGEACPVTDVQYTVSASLLITGTRLGAGDGQHTIGPGKVVVRFDHRQGRETARLITYDLREQFTVIAKALLWETHVTTSLEMRAGTSRSVAAGRLTGRTIVWEGQAGDVRSDGTLTCAGSMCGKFGAPPPGSSEVHTGPNSIELKSFEFSADMKTFTMPYALVSKSDAPQQQTQVSLAGRETGRACVPSANAD